uniref:Phosphoprotein n=1 Tax=Culex pseudovishnui rhabdo-like virus TaxID=2684265 RepID=A0A6F8PZ82_9RHAB|nr:phosphoprotein [Culex pseudovishnui rhabdo-like virus]
MNHSAVFAPGDVFDKKSKSKPSRASQSVEKKSNPGNMSKKSMNSGTGKPTLKHAFSLVPGPKLKKEDLLDQKGLDKVVKSIGDGGLEAGCPVDPINDPPEGCSPPKKPRTPNVLQKGPSRHSQQRTPCGGSGEPGPSTDVSCAMKNLQLHRTQAYLDIESQGIDSSSPGLTSDQSGSSTPTYLDTESDFDDLDLQTRVECNEMGIDPQSLHSDIKELVYAPEDGREIVTAEDCLRAVNVIMADAESLSGRIITGFKIEKGSVIGVLKKSAIPKYPEQRYLGSKTAEKAMDLDKMMAKVPILPPYEPLEPLRALPSVPPKTDRMVPEVNNNRSITLLAPKRRGGAPFRFNVPPGIYDECCSTDLSTIEVASAIMKKMNIYGMYKFTCDYSGLEIEITQE